MPIHWRCMPESCEHSGHACAVAVPSGLETVSHHKDPAFRPILYQDVLTAPKNVFRDGRPADVIHACTPREVVRKFVTDYLATQPTPLVIFLEDNEQWIALKALGIQEGIASMPNGFQSCSTITQRPIPPVSIRQLHRIS